VTFLNNFFSDTHPSGQNRQKKTNSLKQCHIVKNTLLQTAFSELQTAFSEISPTGMYHLNDNYFKKYEVSKKNKIVLINPFSLVTFSQTLIDDLRVTSKQLLCAIKHVYDWNKTSKEQKTNTTKNYLIKNNFSSVRSGFLIIQCYMYFKNLFDSSVFLAPLEIQTRDSIQASKRSGIIFN